MWLPADPSTDSCALTMAEDDAAPGFPSGCLICASDSSSLVEEISDVSGENDGA